MAIVIIWITLLNLLLLEQFLLKNSLFQKDLKSGTCSISTGCGTCFITYLCSNFLSTLLLIIYLTFCRFIITLIYIYYVLLSSKYPQITYIKAYYKLKDYIWNISISNVFYSNIYKNTLFKVFVGILINTFYACYLLIFRVFYI